jgi:acetyl esterase/lipase
MIHGGGHVMLSRKDIRPAQTQTLLESGFLPISIDYRLCPETSLIEGPMQDVLDAFCWAREKLPNITLTRPDIRPDGDRVVAVGWSSGGHLAMTLAWTAKARGVAPPEAVLAFYCPSDYEDPFWSQPNYPFQQDVTCPEGVYDLWEGVFDKPITSYNPPRALGGWMAPNDPRSRIALHMNWKGQALPILLHGSQYKKEGNGSNSDAILPQPTPEEIRAISPLAQARAGLYKTPTFIIHGTLDDLIPYEQAQRTHDAIIAGGINADIRILQESLHLFDIYPDYEKNPVAVQAVADGYEFLRRHVERLYS